MRLVPLESMTEQAQSRRGVGVTLHGRAEQTTAAAWLTSARIPGSPLSVAGIALLLMIVRPVSSNLQNGLILASAFAFCIMAIIANGWRASTQVTLCWLCATAGGAVWCLIGGIRLNPGWVSESIFFIVFPTIFMIIIAASGPRTLGNLLAAIPIGMAIVGGLSLVYLASVRGLLAWRLPDALNLGYGVGNDTLNTAGEVDFGYQIRAFNLSSLAFGAPFLISVVTMRIRFQSRLADWARWPALVLTLSCLFISGRRALIVATAATTVLLLVFLVLRKKDQRGIHTVRTLLLMLVAGVVAAHATGFRVADFIANVAGSGGDVRVDTQGPALITNFVQSPLIGHGLGFTLENYAANREAPWQFEMQYFLILNAMGILGVLFLLIPTAYILIKAGRLALGSEGMSALTLCVLMGTVGILIGNATNPYLHTAGHYWMFFLTVFVVDLYLRSTGVRPTRQSDARSHSVTASEQVAIARRRGENERGPRVSRSS